MLQVPMYERCLVHKSKSDRPSVTPFLSRPSKGPTPVSQFSTSVKMDELNPVPIMNTIYLRNGAGQDRGDLTPLTHTMDPRDMADP